MGVRGLTTLLDQNRVIYRDVRFRDSRLVVDGDNLLCLLYRNSGLDQNHGGQYAAFQALIERFFAALGACRISPYVVLDGGLDHADRKQETLMARAKQRIEGAHRAAAEGSEQGITPPLAKVVFRQTLARLEVPVAQWFLEADQEIAALACEWRCPVLSADSDFCIFDLPGGRLPFAHFQWGAVERGGSRSCIPCKSYNVGSFCTLFGIRRQLLPTFAALSGNDYVRLKSQELSAGFAANAPAGSRRAGHLEGLLRWLRDFQQPQEALEAALELMGELSPQGKAEVLRGWSAGMVGYQLPPSSLKSFFTHGVVPPFPAAEEVASLVPDWIRLPLIQARITSGILDVLVLQRLNLSFPVERSENPCALLTSRPLRQVMYGILLGKPRQVLESERVGLQLTYVKVNPAFRGLIKQLDLHSLDQAEPSQRLQVLLEALHATEAALGCLPPQLHLPVAVTCYWFQRARPHPRVLKALLLGLSNADAPRAAREVRTEGRPDVHVAHNLNQWQACLKDAIYLNQLLGCPLPEPQVARLYGGVLVHHLVHRMKTRQRQGSFLRSDRSCVKLYNTMLKVVFQLYRPKAAPPSSEAQKKPLAPQKSLPLDNLTTSLRQMFLMEDEEMAKEERDLGHRDSVSLRTRFIAKERMRRCSNPEMASRKGCRGPDLF